MNVRQEIDKFSLVEDRQALHWLFDRYHWQSQWAFVASCSHERYGYRSYETNRVWKPTIEGRILYENQKKFDLPAEIKL